MNKLAAQPSAYLPAPEVDDATADHEFSFWASCFFLEKNPAQSSCWFYYFQFHTHTSFTSGIVKHSSVLLKRSS